MKHQFCSLFIVIVLGPVLFSIWVSPIAHVASQFNMHQQQYSDDNQLMLFISPSNIKSSLINLQQFLSSLRSWFFYLFHLALNSVQTEVTCCGTTHQRQSLSSLTSFQVAETSVLFSDYIKILGITLYKRLSFDKHFSYICSISYFNI